MICGIIQSNYIPWRGYFDFIHDCDVFVFHDDIQYTKQDWRNRNKILGPQGPMWLTIPVEKAPTETLIQDIRISDPLTGKFHLDIISAYYKKAPFFDEILSLLKPLYLEPWDNLSTLNQKIIQTLCGYLEIKTPFYQTKDLNITGVKTDRIIQVCQKLKADVYLSGPAARSYLEEALLNKNGIELRYKEYNYSPYPQFSRPQSEFVDHLSILDLIFNCGKASIDYIFHNGKK